ncbi:cwf18 pre-mRNA splicing factor domain-containing protein [Ditylenchus destructor]|nr:cwf18 pre-mRNA splicing factor domain-containing protein [Ditylenchus destructor]
MDDSNGSAQQLSSLEQNAIARKERLKNVREKMNTDQNDENNGSNENNESVLFRSYRPIDSNASSTKADDKQLNVVEEVIEDQIQSTYDTTIKDTLDLDTLAPRKIDWDLRRGIQPKLDLLDRKTQQAIAQSIRNRLQSSESELNSDLLVSAVNAAQLSKNDEND